MRHFSILAAVGVLFVTACSGPPQAPTVELFVLEAPQVVGDSDGIPVFEGGFSGLDLVDGELVAVSDRGPNLEAEARAGRPAKRFLEPDFSPFLATLLPYEGGLSLSGRRPLLRPDGSFASGRPVPASDAGLVETAYGPDFEPLDPDPWGIDAEGVAAASGGGWWIADEYRPSLWLVDREGRPVSRYMPRPSAPEDRRLPAVLLEREDNRGFEGVGVWPDGRVVATLQSPLTVGGAAPGTTVLSRLVILDPQTDAIEMVAFALDSPFRKVGDVHALADGLLLILEHGPAAPGAPWTGHVYLLDTRVATRLADGVALEPLGTADGAGAAGIRLARKTLILDLIASGWPADAHKPEGLALDGTTLWVLSDNDFGLDAPAADGVAVDTGQRTVLARFTLPRRP